jgi:hypothetical protein
MPEPQGAPAPVVVTPAIPSAVTPPAAATPAAPVTPAEPDPKWVADRLERHKKQLFGELGFKDEADAKSALEARRVAEESTKTVEQKRVEAEQRAKKLEGQVTERDELITKLAATKMDGLTEAQRAAIEAVAGKDPILQLNMIDAFAPTWGAAAASAPATPGSPRPAQTAAPTPPAPAPGTPKTDFEKWTDLRTTDPVGASLFYKMNSMRIESSRRT